MVSKVITVLAVASAMTLAACNTVRGAAADMSSAANCTQNTINNGYCK